MKLPDFCCSFDENSLLYHAVVVFVVMTEINLFVNAIFVFVNIM